jgi:glycerol-3-phosphate dehydrogenase
MITVCGGKWTTYRHMAEDCVNQAATLARLPDRPCVTANLAIFNAGELPQSERLHPALPYTAEDVRRAVFDEMARTVEDVLARRTRALFLNARAAMEMAERVADLMALELGRDAAWAHEQVEAFRETASSYLPKVGRTPWSAAGPLAGLPA